MAHDVQVSVRNQLYFILSKQVFMIFCREQDYGLAYQLLFLQYPDLRRALTARMTAFIGSCCMPLASH